MAKGLPRIQLDPDLNKLLEVAAKLEGVSRQAVLQRALRQLILNHEAQDIMRQVALDGILELSQLSAKIEAICDFIADRYAFDRSQSSGE